MFAFNAAIGDIARVVYALCVRCSCGVIDFVGRTLAELAARCSAAQLSACGLLVHGCGWVNHTWLTTQFCSSGGLRTVTHVALPTVRLFGYTEAVACASSEVLVPLVYGIWRLGTGFMWL